MIETARQRGNAAILEHNEHGDVGRAGTALATIYGSLLTRASYVLGHVEGLETDLASAAPRWSQLAEQTPWLAPFWAEYRSILASMYATYGQWTGLDVLNPLKELLQRYLHSCGMLLQARPEGGVPCICKACECTCGRKVHFAGVLQFPGILSLGPSRMLCIRTTMF
jgi:hypothetical protein